jgi:hypothetical protein
MRYGPSSSPDETRLFERRRSSFSTICQLLQDDQSFWIPITRIGDDDSYTIGDILHGSGKFLITADKPGEAILPCI